MLRNIFFVYLVILPIESLAQKKYKELQNRAYDLLKNQKYQEAITIFDELIQKKPKLLENYYWKSFCLLQTSHNEEAIKMLDSAIKKNANYWRFYYARGKAYANLGKFQEALQDYQKAISIESKNDTLFWETAYVYRSLKKYNEAIENYTQAIRLNAQNTELYYQRAHCYALLPEKTNYKEQACSDYQKAFEAGIQQAKIEAWETFKCKFARPTLHKDNSLVPISRIEVEPLSGATIISKGISYERCEIYVGKNGNAFLVGNEISNNSEIVFKIINPRGFRKNQEDKIFFGNTFAIYENNKLLNQSKDLYEDDFSGVDAEMFKTLEFTTNIHGLAENKNSTLIVRFFDKQSNAEITIILPFVVKAKTLKNNFIDVFYGVLGQGTASKSVGNIDIQRIEWRQNQKVVGKLKHSQPFELWLIGVKNVKSSLQAQYAWIDTQNGENVEKNSLILKEHHEKIVIQTLKAPTKTGKYIFWLKLEEYSPQYETYAFTAEIVIE